MSREDRIDLTDAYAVETPEDNRRLYARWADTYESEFTAQHGYRYHLAVAGIFDSASTAADHPVLDVGCGTGLVGEALGVAGLHGFDISPEMLEQAATKCRPDGSAVYGHLEEGDLTGRLSVEAGTYGAIVSAGTFTHGHVGPQAFDELYRIARPGALFVVGVNGEHFADSGFAERFAADVAAGSITEPRRHLVEVYTVGEHADTRHIVVEFRRR